MQTIPDRGPPLRDTIILFLVLSWLTMILRCYVRIRMIKCFAVDDYLAAVTLLLFTVYSGFVLAGLHWGTGRHMLDLTVQQQWNAMKMWWFCELFYILSTTFLRLAAGYFLLRVAMRKRHRSIIHFWNVVNVLFNVFYFFFTLFQCTPVDYWWTRVDGMHVGKCRSAGSADATYAQSAMSAIIDWSFGILPIFIVWDLHMNSRKKVMVAVILGMVALASTATIIRLPYIYTLAHSPDFLWDTQPVAIWSSVEPGLGITALSLATLRPLLKSFFDRVGLSRGYHTATKPYFFDGNMPRHTALSGSIGSEPPFPPARIRPNPFADYDEEMELNNAATKLGNTSRVEARGLKPYRERSQRGTTKLQKPSEPNGLSTWYKGDSKSTSRRESEDDENIAITQTTDVSTTPAIGRAM